MLDRLFNLLGILHNDSQTTETAQHDNPSDLENSTAGIMAASSLDDELRVHERSISGNEIGAVPYDYYDSSSDW